jgi:hypothetical protein
MPTHLCIFCPKAHNRLAQGSMPLPASGRALSAGFPRTAIPVFMGRVSPVLDTCTQLGLLEPGRKRNITCQTIPVKGKSIFERADEIKKLGVLVVICGAVSDAPQREQHRLGLRNHRRYRGGDRCLPQQEADPGPIPHAGLRIASTLQGTFCTLTSFLTCAFCSC